MIVLRDQDLFCERSVPGISSDPTANSDAPIMGLRARASPNTTSLLSQATAGPPSSSVNLGWKKRGR
jgi:hypothetical protein